MTFYYIAVDAQDVIVAVSKEKTKEYLKHRFSLDYLNHIGMCIDEQAISTRIYNPYILYKYNRTNQTIEVASNVSNLKKGIIRNLKLTCENTIKKGFSVQFGPDDIRCYHCSLTDQLAVQQSIVYAQEYGSCPIKCYLNGAPEFLDHSLSECQLVMLEMSKHILSVRQTYFQCQKEIFETSDQEILNLEWTRRD